MSTILTETRPEANINKVDVGTRRGLIQVQKTIEFEWSRNAKKLLGMLITGAFIFALFLIIQIITENQSGVSPTDPSEYFQSYLMFIDFLVLIIATTFFGGIIAEDFEKDTANLLFPKIPKNRLLLGRFFARYTYAFISVAFYYFIIAIATFIKLDGVPKVVWGSMLWAELYLFGVVAFFTLLSSLFKRTSTVMITGILGLLIVMHLLELILMYTGITIEPFFFLTYYAKIITAWFDMPAVDESSAELPFRMGPGGEGGAVDGNTYLQWITPSATGAIIGVLIFSLISFSIAYIIYRKRQI